MRSDIVSTLQWFAYDLQFHGRTFRCSQFVPSGAGYEDAPLVSTICDVEGAIAGQLAVDGDTYLNIKYEYYASHLWR